MLTSMHYNHQWLLEQHQRHEPLQYLFFWGHQPSKDGTITKSCLSQWWQAPFKVEGTTYTTAEHWMMAGKARLFNDTAILQKIVNAPTPAEVKRLGRQISGFDADAWNSHKFELVVTGNLHKFAQHAALKKFLLTTGTRVLAEASAEDPVWGIGMAESNPDVNNPLLWKGENLLGFALMKARDQLDQLT